MNSQPNFLNNPSVTPPHKSWSHWLVVVVAILSVAGYFVASYSLALWPFEKAVGPIVMDMPTPRPSVAPDPFAGWKTYTNTEYGFEFKYPGDWVIREDEVDSGNFTIYAENKNKSYYTDIAGVVTPGLFITISKDTYGSDIDKFIKKYDISTVSRKDPIKIAGNNAFLIEGQTPPAQYNFRVIFYRGYVYEIWYGGSGGNHELKLELENQFEFFLPTFKFIK